MKEQKGITLVALVITIIVMLILVAVSVTVALKGGLFDQAKKAATDTNTEANAERNLSEGIVNIDDKMYDANDYATNANPQPITSTTGE